MQGFKLRPLKEGTPVFGPVQLLADNYDQKRIREALNDEATRLLDPYVRAWKKTIRENLTRYFQHGAYDRSGRMDLGMYRAMQRYGEQTPVGVLTPDKATQWFRDVARLDGTRQYAPDASYNDWITSSVMSQTIESRSEWDASCVFVKMKEAGQIRYSKMDTTTRSMTNEVWGAGFALDWTWLETNMFNINFSDLGAKIKYEAIETICREIYDGVESVFTTTVASQSTILIQAINQAILSMKRYKNSYDKFPYANSPFRILAPPEMQPLLSILENLGGQSAVSPQVPLQRLPVTYTTKLDEGTPTARVIYVVADKWEQNELGTRVPLEAYGPEDDINSFASNTSYRMAYGTALDSSSARKLQFDTTAAAFSVYDPQLVKSI